MFGNGSVSSFSIKRIGLQQIVAFVNFIIVLKIRIFVRGIVVLVARSVSALDANFVRKRPIAGGSMGLPGL